MQGRKPKPTEIKRLEGNPGKRVLNKREPHPEKAAPGCPRQLHGEARKEWQRVVRELKALGVLARVDRAGLASYCAAYGHWADAEMHLITEPAVIKSVSGNLTRSPWVQIAEKSMDQMVKFAAEFGMTPSSRSRVKVETLTPDDELEQILFGANVKIK